MKKVVRYALAGHVIIFIILVVLSIVCDFSIYYHSQYFFDIRFFYLLSVIVSLVVLWKIVRSEKTEHRVLCVIKNILLILALTVSTFYFIMMSFFRNNDFSDYLMLENKDTDKTIIVCQYSEARMGFISVYEQYCKIFLIEKERIELGNETSAEISNAGIDDDGKLTLKCILHTKYDGSTANVDYEVDVSK